MRWVYRLKPLSFILYWLTMHLERRSPYSFAMYCDLMGVADHYYKLARRDPDQRVRYTRLAIATIEGLWEGV